MKFLKKGVLTTIQDFGRSKYQSSGINPGGVMDTLSFRLLNIVLDNVENEACLEIHFPGPVIEFEEDCEFAFTGADFSSCLNDSSLVNNKMYRAKVGDILSFKRKIEGERLYFGVKGGFEILPWLHSKSYQSQLNILSLPDAIEISCSQNAKERKFGVSFDLGLENSRIRFVSSFEYDELEEKSKGIMKKTDFEITRDSNRMGFRLKGFPMALVKAVEMISSSVCKGVIQLLPDGQLVVLMADAQVSGGYPKLGFVIENDLSKLAQLGVGAKMRFERVSYEHAIDIMIKTQNSLELINKSLKLRENEHGYKL